MGTDNTIKKYDRLFATLVLYRHNLQTLHWKIHGEHFDCVHKLMDSYTEKFTEFIDNVAEIMLIEGMCPLSLAECLEVAKNDNETDYLVLSTDDDYNGEDCFKYIAVMFDGLSKLYTQICTDTTTPFEIVSTLDQHKYWLRLENSYKNTRRMI